MLERCMSLGGGLRMSPSFGAARTLRHPRALLLDHHRSARYLTSTINSKGTRNRSQVHHHHHQHQEPQSIPVAIVGAGPAGLTLSALLSKFGVPSILLERAPALPMHPQAHFINLRSMEIMRHAMGGLDRKVLEMCPPQEEWRHFVVCSTLLGRHLACVDNFHGEEEAERRALSPTDVAHLSQNVLLPLLLEEARSAATGSCPSSQIVFDTEVTGVRRLDNNSSDLVNPGRQLELLLRRRDPSSSSAADDNNGRSGIVCKYAIAADGASSSVRAAAGMGLSGRRELGHLVNIHFQCKELGKLLLGGEGREGRRRPGMLYFVYNEETICVLVAHNIQKGEWACQVPFFPPHQTAKFFTPERSMSIIREALGPGGSHLDINVCSVRPWTMNALVADSYFRRYCTREGKGVNREGGGDGEGPGVFLVGDAAHQFPPAGGFGLNTGVQDAHNLAWKLAAVHHSLASPDLLRTYEEERRPVAMRNAALSVRNLKRSLRVLKALGVDPRLGASASLMDQLVRSPLALDWSNGIGELASLFSRKESRGKPDEERSESILRLGRRQLQSLRKEGHPYGESRVRELRRLLAEGGGLPLLFPEHDLGFKYVGEGAAVFPGMGPSATAKRSPTGIKDNEPPIGGVPERRDDHKESAPCSSLSHSSYSSSSGSLTLGGRMPHFALKLLLDSDREKTVGDSDSDGDGAIGELNVGSSIEDMSDSSMPSVSTVDLPDHIRETLLDRFGGRGMLSSDAGCFPIIDASGLPVAGIESTGLKASPAFISGDASIDDKGTSRECRTRTNAGLGSVLIVVPKLTGEIHGGSESTNCGDGRSNNDSADAASAASRKWLNAAIAAQCRGVGGGSGGGARTSSGEGSTGAPGRTSFPPLVVVTVCCTGQESAPAKTKAGMNLVPHGTPSSRQERGAAIEGRQPIEATLASVDNCGIGTTDGGDGGGSDSRSKARNQGESGSAPPGAVLFMHAIDDSAGKLESAFAAAGADAVLIRPDGHIAWLARRQTFASNREERERRGYSVPAEELERALDAVYGWRDRR